MPPPTFLIPSLVWYGNEPLLEGVRLGPLVSPLDTWGGALTREDDVRNALLAVDAALVLLNLAGYQALEVAIGVPSGTAATAVGDLVSVDLTTMEIHRGTAREWSPLDTAHVSLWIEPRFDAAPARPPTPTLDLAPVANTLGDDSIELGFAETGTGWLRITWAAGDPDLVWLDELIRQRKRLTDATIAQLDFYRALASVDAGEDSVVCGLLNAYDSRTWKVPFPIDGSDGQPTRELPGIEEFGVELGELMNGNLSAFLTGEVADAPESALDRWTAEITVEERRQVIENLSIAADEAASQFLDLPGDDPEAAAEAAGETYAAFRDLPVTTVLYLWETLGVIDFLGFAEPVLHGVVVDDGEGTLTTLAKGWVYLRDDVSGDVAILFTDDDGKLYSTNGPTRDAPWEYTVEFAPEAGAELTMAYSKGARPVPERLLTDPELEQWFTAVTIPAGDDPAIVLPDTHIAVTTPVELELWPVMWQISTAAEDPYLTQDLDQGAAVWDAAGKLITDESGRAPLVPENSAVAPKLRGLVVKGNVDAAAHGVEIELVTRDGTTITQRRSLAANAPPVTRVGATLGPVSGARRSFDATVVLDPAALPERFGDVQILVVRHGLDGSRIEAVSQLLIGAQIALVEDPAPDERGRILGARNEILVVDFRSSPQATSNALKAQTRVRRMIEYRIRIGTGLLDPARPADPVTNPQGAKSVMPLWMAEAHLAGADRTALKDLMRRRAFRVPPPADGTPPRPVELLVELEWELRVSWKGPDFNGVAAGVGDRPGQHHEYTQTLPKSQQVLLRFNATGDLVDARGRPVALEQDGALPGALPVENRPAFVDRARRRPEVLLDHAFRSWGRYGAVAPSSLVVEFQPILSDGARELILGGDGSLTLTSLRLHDHAVDPGRVLSGANAVAAGSTAARLPDFRVPGDNPAPAQTEAIVDAVVARLYQQLRAAGGATGTVTLSQACWQETMNLVVKHESGPARIPNQFDERGTNRWGFGGVFYGTQKGMPIFGPPHGYGMGQLDAAPGATPDQVWNFVANLDRATQMLVQEKAAVAYGDLDDHLPAAVDHRFRAELQRAAVRRYNGGTEFRWDAAANEWKIRPSVSQWTDPADHSKGPSPNVTYPNEVLSHGAVGVVYYTDAAGNNANDRAAVGANAVFPWPIDFTAADFGPLTDQVP